MKRDTNLVFDIGLHIGQDTEFYLKKGFKVVAFDANPLLCENAHDRFSSEIASGQLVVIEGCIADEPGDVSFYVNKEVTEWSSSSEVLGSRKFGSQKITVKGITIPEIIEEHGVPYYMKIDIEGADIIPVRGLTKANARPVYVSYEASTFDAAAVLFVLGYKRFSVLKQRAIPNIALPRPAKEGQFAEHVFPLGSSGPFGAELTSDWGSLDDCIRELVQARLFHRNIPGKQQDWADIHAYSALAEREFKLAA